MLVTTLEADPYLGRVLTGRIEIGRHHRQPPDQGAEPRRQGRRAGPRHQTAWRSAALARVPVERAEAGDIVAIAGLQTATVADTLCDIASRDADLCHADRSADPGDDRFGERFPAGRARRRQGAKPRDPRPAAARGRRQCRHPCARDRRRRLRSRRARRTAAGRADRDHAARRLRGLHQPAARALQDRSRITASGWSRSRKSPSTSTIPIPAW